MNRILTHRIIHFIFSAVFICCTLTNVYADNSVFRALPNVSAEKFSSEAAISYPSSSASENEQWKLEYYEKAYPHAGVEFLYVNGKKTSVWRYSKSCAAWPAEFKPELWEIQYPYKIYERLYSRVNNISWTPNYPNEAMGIKNSDVFRYSGKCADVKREYRYFGFGRFRVDSNGTVTDAAETYRNILGYIPEFPYTCSDVSLLSEKNSDGSYVISDSDIAEKIKTFDSEYLTGPDFSGSTKTIDTVAYVERAANGANAENWSSQLSWCNTGLIIPSGSPCKVGWLKAWEKAGAYNKEYEILTVNGTPLDGRIINTVYSRGGEIKETVRMPYVYRYTGIIKYPKTEWKYAWFEASAPYCVYAEKWLDGIPTRVLAHTGEFNNPQSPKSIKGVTLMYHLLSENPADWSNYCISPQKFEDDVAYFKNSGYAFITAEEYASFFENPPPVIEKYVIITFDDGYASDYEKALPILEKYGAKATFFVASDYIGTPGYLSAEQLKNLSKSPNVQIGCHGHKLHAMSAAELNTLYSTNSGVCEAVYDFEISKNIIENIIEKPITALSYPYGLYTENLHQNLMAGGARIIYGTVRGIRSKVSFAAPTKRINRADSDNIETIARGIY